MSYRRLFLFAEGPDDERFLDGIVRPELKQQFDCITICKYANQTRIKTKAFLRLPLKDSSIPRTAITCSPSDAKNNSRRKLERK